MPKTIAWKIEAPPSCCAVNGQMDVTSDRETTLKTMHSGSPFETRYVPHDALATGIGSLISFIDGAAVCRVSI